MRYGKRRFYGYLFQRKKALLLRASYLSVSSSICFPAFFGGQLAAKVAAAGSSFYKVTL
jgi:hypothetical protein